MVDTFGVIFLLFCGAKMSLYVGYMLFICTCKLFNIAE